MIFYQKAFYSAKMSVLIVSQLNAFATKPYFFIQDHLIFVG